MSLRDDIAQTLVRIATTGIAPARWFLKPPEPESLPGRSGVLEIVSHCWQYAHLLAYQVVHGDVARQCGYCEQIPVYQRPAPCWAKTYEDTAYRWLLGTDGVGHEVPGVHRIRHVRKGRYGESRTAAALRGNIRRAKESLQRP